MNSYEQLKDETAGMLFEAWNIATKQKVIDYAKTFDMELEDHVVAGDYDISLWTMPHGCNDPDGNKVSYGIAINSCQHNPLDPATQYTKYPGSSLKSLPIKSVLQVIYKWVNRYGQLFVGSGDLRKLEIYKSLLEKRFNIKYFNTSHGSPFFISNKTPADIKQESGYDCIDKKWIIEAKWPVKVRCLLYNLDGDLLQRRIDSAVIKWSNGEIEHVDYYDGLRFNSIAAI